MRQELSKDELDFIKWWEKNRDDEIKWNRSMRKGIGMGLMLSFPIVLAVFFRGWYKRMPFVSGTQLLFILFACMLISVFYALFKGRMEWEAKETRYKQLKGLSSDND
jgi:hypothetical protein